jgi:NADH-quinone oxidoreductase subunit J
MMASRTFFFYLFSSSHLCAVIASAFMVIAARNPVHSVLFLILTFFNAAGLFVLMGAEFLAMILVVVYVGAVAVLFLFVVMMLDVDFAELRRASCSYLPIGALVGLILLVELSGVGGAIGRRRIAARRVPIPGVTNTEALGQVLYTRYVFLFQMGRLVLLVAMIGAIVLTLRHKPGASSARTFRAVGRKRQRPASNSSRSSRGRGSDDGNRPRHPIISPSRRSCSRSACSASSSTARTSSSS